MLSFVHEYVVNILDHKLAIAGRGENGGRDRLSRADVGDAEFLGSLSPKTANVDGGRLLLTSA